MQVLNVEAVTTFSHGRLTMHSGDTAKLEADEARQLEKAGLVTTSGAEEEAEPKAELKMAPITSNKMEKPASNK